MATRTTSFRQSPVSVKPSKGRAPAKDALDLNNNTMPPAELRKRAEAPRKVVEHTSTADDRRRKEARARLQKEAVRARERAERDQLLEQLVTRKVTPVKVGAALLQFSVSDLVAVAKAHGYKGYSRLKREELVSFLRSGGVKPVVAKRAPNIGTADYHKQLLRGGLSRGFTTEATTKAKAMFGCAISGLKAAQLRALCVALGLVK